MREPFADLLDAGSHGTTYGGSPLACAVALKILEVIERERLADNARGTGDGMKQELVRMARNTPSVIQQVRGLGLMIGIELAGDIPAFCGEWTNRLQFNSSIVCTRRDFLRCRRGRTLSACFRH